MRLDFVKMHGIGNDFIMVDLYSRQLPNRIHFDEIAKILCRRHFGIGADGLILILPSEKYEFKMRIFNFDGSEAQMCGNGIRCFAKFVYENNFTSNTKFSVETLAGEIIPELIFGCKGNKVIEGVRVDMGIPRLMETEIPMIGNSDRRIIDDDILLENGEHYRITCVSMGNPHCVIFTEGVENFPVQEIGPLIEKNVLFPEKTNVEFIQPVNENEIVFRVWERGVGETLACGTGASAAVVAGVLNHRIKREATVHLRGGDLRIEWKESDGHVYMTGPAENVFQGSVWID